MIPATVVNGNHGPNHDNDTASPLINGVRWQENLLTHGPGGDSTSIAWRQKLNSTTDGVWAQDSDNASNIPRLHISEDYTVSESPIGTVRPVRIICIGAGASGVNLAYQIQQNMQKTDLVIYEKNPSIGGTWYENRYPGCKCDIREDTSCNFLLAGVADWTDSLAQLPVLLGTQPKLERDVFSSR
jgi:hypothetical protein